MLAPLLLLFLLPFDTAQEYNETLVSFGKLSQLDIEDSFKLRELNSLQEDQLNPGGFIAANQHSLTLITPDLRAVIVAGKENGSGYNESFGGYATFSNVVDAAQYNNGEDILVADNKNNCIRTVNKDSRRTRTFVGRCDFGGSFTGTVPALEANIPGPFSILHDQERNRFFYLTYEPSSIIEHNLSTDEVTLRYQNPEEFVETWAFVADSTFSYLYVTHEGGISKMDTNDWNKTLVAGSNKWEEGEPLNGPLLEARFDLPGRMVWLIQDQVLLVSEPYKHSFRVINLEDGLVTTICKGEDRYNPTYILGGPKTCEMNNPLGLTVSNGSVYIGETLGADGRNPPRQAVILKLEYFQPICRPPPPAFGVKYEPEQEQYIHKDTITFSCESGLGFETGYDTITCIRAMNENGTVSGKWDPPIIPKCKAPEVTSISATSGQMDGGNEIELYGTFSNNVTIVINYSDGQEVDVQLTKHTSIALAFNMPPYKMNTQNEVTIALEQVKGENRSLIWSSTYIYLPNPIIDFVSRSSSIARGGLPVILVGRNLLSSSVYSLRLSKGPDMVADIPCDRTKDAQGNVIVQFYTPNVENLFRKRFVKRSLEGEKITLTANMLSHGMPVAGVTDVIFTVVNTEPEFTNFTSKPISYNLHNETVLKMKGRYLANAVLLEDYQVTLMSRGDTFSCVVTRVDNSELSCQPNNEAISSLLLASDFSLTAMVKVNVGQSIQTDIGVVSFYNKKTIDPVEIAVPVVVGLVVIMVVAIIISRLYKKRCQKAPLEVYNPELVSKGDETGLEQLICLDIRTKLEDMYIEPSSLNFDLKSDPIGKGHFGSVYLGQLRVKGNILKTVAVKTLKVTEDINLCQLEDFLQEASFVKYYNHVNILVTLGVVWKKRDRPYVVLPYMAFGDLHSLIKRPEMRFTNGDLMHFGMQVATGMEYLTAQKCIHRDLAARNCLVNETFLVKIGDFGMSKDIYTDNFYRESNKSKPKPAKWMALESWRDGVYDSHTEVWSYGVLLWELFTRGGEPYPELNNREVFDYLEDGGRLPRPTYTHPQVFQEVSRCWDAKPLARPTFTHFKEFFQNLFNGGCDNLPPMVRDQTEQGEYDFRYSYAKDLTCPIPEDYVENELYEDERLCIEYREYDYERPVTSISSVDTEQPAHRLSQPNLMPATANDYICVEPDDQAKTLGVYSLKVTPTPMPRSNLSCVSEAMNEYSS
ncbi:hepatocyte growth factor receptor-like isoform X1 [Watersipora subatra]|uniref:hepatocyte growth factor receptor-like isoform X1 n=2 Tax=Watersipora subatra TaxID=2589382 RepID=UPI00355B22C9